MFSCSILSIFYHFLTISHLHSTPHQGSISTVDDWKLTMNHSRQLALASQPVGSSSARQRSPSASAKYDWTTRQDRQSAGDTRGSTAQRAYLTTSPSARHNPTSPKKSVSMMEAGVIDVFYPEPELPREQYYEEFDDEVSVNSTTTRVGNEFRVRHY